MSDVTSRPARTSSSGDPTALAASLAEEPAADVVEVLNRRAPDLAAVVLLALPETQAVEVLDQPQLVHAAAIVSRLPPERAAGLLDQISADRAAGVVREMRVSDRNDLLTRVAPTTKAALDRLLPYPENCAGGIMTTEFVAVPADWSIAQVLAHVRAVEHARETVYAIFVIDPQSKTLRAAVPLRRLIAAEPAANVLTAASARKLITVTPEASLDDTVHLISKYNLLAIPVVDTVRRLIGIVTVDDALDTLVAQQDAQVQHFGGVEPLDEPYMRIGFLMMIRKRAGWLCVLFIAEMLTASAMQTYEDELEKAIVLSLFIPLIMSSGGNSGSQATSLLIRAIALKDVRLRDWWRVILRELPAGVLLGGILGALGAVRITAWQITGLFDYGPHWRLIALTIAAALVGIVTFGSLVGSMLPFIAKRLGFDPATASAPFVATLVDVTGIVIYFTIATIILRGTLL
ncbi:MAG: magnesium transporter [Acetobacteraceae bacterium]|nr:magnesium transporter [Acetobacteraceae bacterium]